MLCGDWPSLYKARPFPVDFEIFGYTRPIFQAFAQLPMQFVEDFGGNNYTSRLKMCGASVEERILIEVEFRRALLDILGGGTSKASAGR